MSKRFFVFVGAIIIVGITGAVFLYLGYPKQPTRSPYVAQLNSSVRGLSSQEVDDLLNGRGAGFARMAELNSYPGPRHVLDMQQELALSPEQIEQIEVAFAQMDTAARELGQEIIRCERELSATFASGTASAAEIQKQTEALAHLYGQLRLTHLQAHLRIKPLLSPDQIAEYNTLRGYTPTSEQAAPVEPHHQGH